MDWGDCLIWPIWRKSNRILWVLPFPSLTHLIRCQLVMAPGCKAHREAPRLDWKWGPHTLSHLPTNHSSSKGAQRSYYPWALLLHHLWCFSCFIKGGNPQRGAHHKFLWRTFQIPGSPGISPMHCVSVNVGTRRPGTAPTTEMGRHSAAEIHQMFTAHHTWLRALRRLTYWSLWKPGPQWVDLIIIVTLQSVLKRVWEVCQDLCRGEARI